MINWNLLELSAIYLVSLKSKNSFTSDPQVFYACQIVLCHVTASADSTLQCCLPSKHATPTSHFCNRGAKAWSLNTQPHEELKHLASVESDNPAKVCISIANVLEKNSLKLSWQMLSSWRLKGNQLHLKNFHVHNNWQGITPCRKDGNWNISTGVDTLVQYLKEPLLQCSNLHPDLTSLEGQ